ncbi:MFS transporter [Nocardia sp. NPDC049190]|uniref:MFS transporter n=1 Tax=Nocardia sp. NPDC049190 TaxID=3155650 RepID=UPI0033FB7527
MSRGSGRLAGLLVVACLQNAAYTALVPFVPFLSEEFRMGPYAIGLVFGGFIFAKALVQPVGGWLSDRYSARLVAIIGLLVTALGSLGVGWADSGWLLIGFRILWGIGEGLSMPALYRLVGLLGRDRPGGEPRAMGLFGFSAMSGTAFGPVVIALFPDVMTFHRVLFLSSLIIVASAVALAVSVRAAGTRTADYRDQERGPQGDRSRNSIAGGVTGVVLGLGVLDMLDNIVFSGLEPAFPLYLHDILRADTRHVSAILSIALICFAVASAVTGRIIRRDQPLVMFGSMLVIRSAVLISIPFISTLWIFSGAFIFLMITLAMAYVMIRSMLSTLRTDNPGVAFGWFGLISDIGLGIGPLISPVLVHDFGGWGFAALSMTAVPALIVVRYITQKNWTTGPESDDDRRGLEPQIRCEAA